MKIREVLASEYVKDYVHPDVEKQIAKYSKRHNRKIRMGYGPSIMSYPYRVEGKKWSAKYKKSINCSNPKGFSQKAHCAGRKKK